MAKLKKVQSEDDWLTKLEAITLKVSDTEGMYTVQDVVATGLKELPFDADAAHTAQIRIGCDKLTKRKHGKNQLILEFGPGWIENMDNHWKLGNGERIPAGKAKLPHAMRHSKSSRKNRQDVVAADDITQEKVLAFAEWTVEQQRLGIPHTKHTFLRFAKSIQTQNGEVSSVA